MVVEDVKLNVLGVNLILETKIMENKVISIKVKVPKETTLPDGYYKGSWCGSCITMTYNQRQYELVTEEGIRGRCDVVIEVKDGNVTFDEINA